MTSTRRFIALCFLMLVAAVALVGSIASADSGKPSSGGRPDPGKIEAAIIADAAAQLNVSSDQLKSALLAAVDNQVDKMVASGKITSDKATKLKAQIAKMPLVALPPAPTMKGKGDSKGGNMCPSPQKDGQGQGGSSGSGSGSNSGQGRGGCNPGLGHGGSGGAGGPGDGQGVGNGGPPSGGDGGSPSSGSGS